MGEWVSRYSMEYHSNKKEQTINTCNNLRESQKHYAEWKKPVSEFHAGWFHLYDILKNIYL